MSSTATAAAAAAAAPGSSPRTTAAATGHAAVGHSHRVANASNGGASPSGRQHSAAVGQNMNGALQAFQAGVHSFQDLINGLVAATVNKMHIVVFLQLLEGLELGAGAGRVIQTHSGETQTGCDARDQEREREELEKGRQQLEEERRAFQDEAKRVQHVLQDGLSVSTCSF